MKVFIKTLKNSQFEIQVDPDDTVADVKKNIESAQGKNLYPADEQMLIYQGKILSDSTTMSDNNVTEDKFIVIMLKKKTGSSSGASAPATMTPSSQATPASPVSATPLVSASATPLVQPSATALPPTATSAPSSAVATATEINVYGQAASNLVAGSNLEQTIQQILDMGGGCWDRDTVVRALRAAYNNPERAVQYLYSGIPEQAEAPPVTRVQVVKQPTP